jgi:dihydrofolate synthase / folylpolyglutamate synthase
LSWQTSCHPSAIDLGLDRVQRVAERLGIYAVFDAENNPVDIAKVITVAGTNGKGSCVAALETLCLNSGHTCGVYSSPHILHYRERIRLNGDYVTDEQLCCAFEKIDQARGEISLTYFEFGTLAAMLLFAELKLSIWILEVGLGGRLDATNILNADVAVVTSIDLDHMDWLGNDRESIGFEKVGICRAERPLICADPNPPNSILQQVKKLRCPYFQIDSHFGYMEVSAGTVFWFGALRASPILPKLPKTSLAAALQAWHCVTGETHLPVHLLGELKLAGRLERQQMGNHAILLDVAHNPAAMAHLAQQLSGQKFAVILAMMADKNLPDSVLGLTGIVDSWHLTTIPDLPRAASVEQLKLAALSTQLIIHIHGTVADAIEHCLATSPEIPILVTGSFYTVAAAKEYLILRGEKG